MEPVSTNQGQGVESKNYVTFDEYLSGKGKIEISTGTIPDRVVVLDTNGNIKQDTGYITTILYFSQLLLYSPMEI